MKEHENKGQCTNSQEIISYVYNEMSTAERDRFDVHLENCTSCIEELAELSLSYYSVFEWRKLEFDPLPTPFFELPRTSEKISLLDWLREMLSPSSAWLTAGSFAAILVTASVGIWIWNSSSTVDLASVKEIELVPVNKAGNGQRATEPSANLPDRTRGDLPVEPKGVDDLNVARGASKTRETTNRSRPIKVSEPASKAAPIRNDRRSTVAVTVTTPQLIDFDDVQDDSLRLADILDDLDTSD